MCKVTTAPLITCGSFLVDVVGVPWGVKEHSLLTATVADQRFCAFLAAMVLTRFDPSEISRAAFYELV